ncbi:Amino acid permease 2 [Capsicum baccatum]|uniref:Amino acid permease 2 n=1 Tax=Capsicum baccatum TaxID=33114 RepID=A0A2G2WTF8_CAPBA|nr:Amino acid permease 2 [Capsicum baccatum]
MQKIWKSFQALGSIAFAYTYCLILIEIQDTLKSPPAEAKTTKKATLVSVAATTVFYMLCGCFGYAAFGDQSPGNLLTGFGFYNPYWLLDIANMAIVVHLVGAYQVFCQPLFAFVEKTAAECLEDDFRDHNNGISMLMPFFNDVVGIIGSFSFWPLTVYFPVEMYIVQKNIPNWSGRWICLQLLSGVCLVISIAASVGSFAGIVSDLQVYRPFKT